jgi:uncharacterized protein YkwD
VLALAAAPGASGAASGCPHARSRPDEATIPQLRRATLCLLNQARTANGLDPLRRDRHLSRIANRHSKRMVEKQCFEHVCGSEDPLPKRLKLSGYLNGAKKWGYAEDLGYETTPKQMVARWLGMPYDRKNLLNRKYANVGIGLAAGTPSPSASDQKFVTYTVDLAWRKPPA